MTETKRCWACQGSKQIMTGGCILKECHVCSGTGYLYSEKNNEVSQVEAKELDNVLPDKPKKKVKNKQTHRPQDSYIHF